jgi:hypothetical protein
MIWLAKRQLIETTVALHKTGSQVSILFNFFFVTDTKLKYAGAFVPEKFFQASPRLPVRSGASIE